MAESMQSLITLCKLMTTLNKQRHKLSMCTKNIHQLGIDPYEASTIVTAK